MCFTPDARPPELPADLRLAPMAGGSGARRLELTAADDNRFGAALAESSEGFDVGVVILPDVRGLYRFYIELAERFAEAGRHAIAIDYFGRTAGVAERDGDFDYWPHVEQTRAELVQADIAAAQEALREHTGVAASVTVGFCYGGLQSFLAATNRDLDLAGIVGFYGALVGTRLGMPSPLEHTGQMRGPILGLFGEADQGISGEQVDAFERGLAEAGVEHEIVRYPGAPHSFFDRSFEEHAEACADAWRRVLGFLGQVGAKV
jgi:carboxymethylenebutenolidase